MLSDVYVCGGLSKGSNLSNRHNKSLGPNGFSAEFCQHGWDVIKYDLLHFLMIYVMVISNYSN
jgi:hypothetical protein